MYLMDRGTRSERSYCAGKHRMQKHEDVFKRVRRYKMAASLPPIAPAPARGMHRINSLAAPSSRSKVRRVQNVNPAWRASHLRKVSSDPGKLAEAFRHAYIQAAGRGAPLVFGGTDYLHGRPTVQARYLDHRRVNEDDSDKEAEEKLAPAAELATSPAKPNRRVVVMRGTFSHEDVIFSAASATKEVPPQNSPIAKQLCILPPMKSTMKSKTLSKALLYDEALPPMKSKTLSKALLYDEARRQRLDAELAAIAETQRQHQRGQRDSALDGLNDESGRPTILIRELSLDTLGTDGSEVCWVTIGFREFKKIVRERVWPQIRSKKLRIWYHTLDSHRNGSIDLACFFNFAIREAVLQEAKPEEEAEPEATTDLCSLIGTSTSGGADLFELYHLRLAEGSVELAVSRVKFVRLVKAIGFGDKALALSTWQSCVAHVESTSALGAAPRALGDRMPAELLLASLFACTEHTRRSFRVWVRSSGAVVWESAAGSYRQRWRLSSLEQSPSGTPASMLMRPLEGSDEIDE